jgi:ABC-type phosphate transport system substrate-binding protein
MEAMRKLRTLAAAVVAVSSLTLITAGPAFADPPTGTTPRAADAVGTGSDSTQYLLDQLAYSFDHANPSAATKLYSWDAVNPDTLAIGDNIVTKKGCAAIARPDGSGAGIAALEANAHPSGDTTNYCVDYARSSRAPESTDPACASGGVCFVPLAGDAVTWADRSAAAGGTDAPANLTTAQLVKIYECTITNWDRVGGLNAPIEAYLPQTSSGTRQFFLTALGGGVTPITPGSCVIDGTTSDPNSLEENEGINPLLNSPEAIFPFSVGSWLSQTYHSATCTNSDCSEVGPTTPPCPLTTGKNRFGCNEAGVLQLNTLNGSKPTTPWPVTSKSVVNTGFDALFQRTLFDVVRYDPNSTDHIPGAESGAPGGINLEQFFGSTGYFCSKAEQATIKAYGFEPTWKLSHCGDVS